MSIFSIFGPFSERTPQDSQEMKQNGSCPTETSSQDTDIQNLIKEVLRKPDNPMPQLLLSKCDVTNTTPMTSLVSLAAKHKFLPISNEAARSELSKALFYKDLPYVRFLLDSHSFTKEEIEFFDQKKSVYNWEATSFEEKTTYNKILHEFILAGDLKYTKYLVEKVGISLIKNHEIMGNAYIIEAIRSNNFQLFLYIITNSKFIWNSEFDTIKLNKFFRIVHNKIPRSDIINMNVLIGLITFCIDNKITNKNILKYFLIQTQKTYNNSINKKQIITTMFNIFKHAISAGDLQLIKIAIEENILNIRNELNFIIMHTIEQDEIFEYLKPYVSQKISKIATFLRAISRKDLKTIQDLSSNKEDLQFFLQYNDEIWSNLDHNLSHDIFKFLTENLKIEVSNIFYRDIFKLSNKDNPQVKDELLKIAHYLFIEKKVAQSLSKYFEVFLQYIILNSKDISFLKAIFENGYKTLSKRIDIEIICTLMKRGDLKLIQYLVGENKISFDPTGSCNFLYYSTKMNPDIDRKIIEYLETKEPPKKSKVETKEER